MNENPHRIVTDEAGAMVDRIEHQKSIPSHLIFQLLDQVADANSVEPNIDRSTKIERWRAS
jgi:hypothetical protein